MNHRLPLLCLLPALLLGGCRANAPTATPPGSAPAPAAAAPPPTRAAVAPADARRARGSGFLYVGEDRLQFTFIVKNTGLPGGMSMSGTLAGEKFAMQGMAAEVGIADGKVTFSGETSFNGKPARFTVDGTDDPASDALSLRVSVEGGADRVIAGPLHQKGSVDIEPM